MLFRQLGSSDELYPSVFQKQKHGIHTVQIANRFSSNFICFCFIPNIGVQKLATSQFRNECFGGLLFELKSNRNIINNALDGPVYIAVREAAPVTVQKLISPNDS